MNTGQNMLFRGFRINISVTSSTIIYGLNELVAVHYGTDFSLGSWFADIAKIMT